MRNKIEEKISKFIKETEVPKKKCKYCGKLRPSYLIGSHEKSCPKNPKAIKEVEVSNLVAPELNVDRDRDEWLRKQGKKEAKNLGAEPSISKSKSLPDALRAAEKLGWKKVGDRISGGGTMIYIVQKGGKKGELYIGSKGARLDIVSNEGRMSGMQASGVFEQGGKRYTAFVRWPNGDDEEVDVDANNDTEARKKVEKLLKTDYNPGGKIVQLKQRFGLYM